jgi:hypothetical protein
MQQYEVGDTLPDGCTVGANTTLRSIRRLKDEQQQVREDDVVPGSAVVEGEAIVGWAGVTNIHIANLQNKSTSTGVCFKTLCDSRTRVMASFEFVEGRRNMGTSITTTWGGRLHVSCGSPSLQEGLVRGCPTQVALPRGACRNHERNDRAILAVNGKQAETNGHAWWSSHRLLS